MHLRAPHKTSHRRPADTCCVPALHGFDVHSHAFLLAPWRANVSFPGSVRFCSALLVSRAPVSVAAMTTLVGLSRLRERRRHE